jgi:DNA-binding response OmpR family regulator
MMETVRVLSFNFPAALQAVQAGILSRPPFAAEAVSRASDLLTHLEGLPYRLMILAMPGDGLEFRDILPIVRNPAMPSSSGSVMLLTPAERVEEHRAFLHKGLDVVLPRTAAPEAVEAEIARQVKVAPRANTRVMLRLNARIRAQNTLIMCQTANISPSGLFLIHAPTLPVGTVFTFELLLPKARAPIAGEARVVRHAFRNKEKYEGMGAAFISLPPESRKLLQEFVSRTQNAGGA